MPGGRPPKPIEQKLRNGNPGKRAIKARSVDIVPAEGSPPVPIVLDAPGRAMWTHVWAGGGAWLHPQIDLIRVETACRLYDEIAKHREAVARLGTLLSEPIATPAGVVVGERVVANPAVKMLRDAEKQLDRELSALGFDPTSRSRLGLNIAKRESILDGLSSQTIEAEVIEIAPDA